MARNNTYNAAERLLGLMQKLKVANGAVSTWQVYIEIFGHGRTQADALMFAYELAKLADEVESTIKTNDRIETTLLTTLNSIFRVCRLVNLEGAWKSYASLITNEGITALQAYSIFFSDVFPETKISDEEYKGLTEQIQGIMDEVLHIENEELRGVLISILESARRCIFLYRVNGSQPFEDVFVFAFGKLSVKLAKGDFTKDESDGIVTKVFNFTMKLGDVAAAVNAMTALPSGVKDLFKQIGK